MHAIWKAAILGATLGGLSIAGAGTALADTGYVAPPALGHRPTPIGRSTISTTSTT